MINKSRRSYAVLPSLCAKQFNISIFLQSATSYKLGYNILHM